MLKRLAVVAVIAAALLGLYLLPTAGASSPAAGAAVATRTLAKAAANELRAGEKLIAPRLGWHVRRYQWLRCGVTGHACKAIARATRRTYIVRAADVGHTLRVREVLQGNTIAVSAATAQVGRPLPVNTAAPTITDGGQGGGNVGAPTTVVVGDVLTGSNGTWTNAIAFTYQWLDCDTAGQNCTPIAGATSQGYTVASTDVGHTIVFQVTGYNYQPGG